jgi:shikimate kinase
MKIVLLGYRAVGKSTLGKQVARRLEWPYCDIDRGIEAAVGQTISEFYQAQGDAAYRAVESEVVAQMCRADHCVIAFGAGSVMRPANRAHAKRDALVFSVAVRTPQILWARMQGDPASASTRPPLRSGGYEEVVEMLAQRQAAYSECADVVLDATCRPEALADQVVEAYERQQKKRRSDHLEGVDNKP